MCIPGPKEPKDFQSSFRVKEDWKSFNENPLVNEIHDVQANDGIEIAFYGGKKRKVRIHVILLQGDTPAASKAAGLRGHKSVLHVAPVRFKAYTLQTRNATVFHQ